MVQEHTGRLYVNKNAGVYSINFAKSFIEDTTSPIKGNCPVIYKHVVEGILIVPDLKREKEEKLHQ